ncbi:uncharacterized protein [Amphiura filiformis]|uniref:uncharacterized protein n=1 Tax=Amphiura filiformis TaxID=82378 RepID=UPI003B21F052
MASSSQQLSTDKPHLMISYQWDAQKRMLLLRDELIRAGFDVWMDVDQMEGNMDERMAEAVEQASVVLVCFSKKYQESANCKKELQYAASERKHIVPLKYEDYKPSNWLGLLINSLLYYEVHTNEAMLKNLPNIIRALDKKGVSRRFGGTTEDNISCSKSSVEGSESSQPTQGFVSGFSIIKREDVALGSVLGGGGFGTVYLAGHKHWGDVAVKQFKSLVSEDVRREAEKMWRAISSPYLVRIMGIIDDPQHLSIVMEYFENGNLKDFRQKYMQSDGCVGRKIRMILDMSLGMNYLHTLSPPILHRDLKLSNIFVGNGFEAKIGDLGLAINVKSSSEGGGPSVGGAGTCTHLPPEAWAKSNVQAKEPFDIYTFGITLSEFLNGQDPWPFSATASQIKNWVLNSKRPELSNKAAQNSPSEIVDLMQQCWHQDPNLRPSFQDIQKRVSVLYDQKYRNSIHGADDLIRAEIRKAAGVSGKMTTEGAGDSGVVASSGRRDGASGIRPDVRPRGTAKTVGDSGIGLSSESFANKLQLEQPSHLMTKIKEFGQEGSDEELERARGIAVSAAGDVIVADSDRKQVLLYTVDGKYKSTLTSPDGIPEGQLRTPQDVAVSEDGGCLMVVDLTRYVKIFDADGSYIQSFHTREKGAADKRIGTSCIDIDCQGQILVGNQKSQLITIHDVFDGSIKNTIDLQDIIKPYFLTVNRKEQILIGDYDSKKVKAIDYVGKVLFTINPKVEYGAACKPLGVACNPNANDDIFVAVIGVDSAGNDAPDTGRILRYTNTGLFMACVAKDLYYPMGITFTQDGRLLIAANYNSVLVLGHD